MDERIKKIFDQSVSPSLEDISLSQAKLQEGHIRILDEMEKKHQEVMARFDKDKP